MKQIRRKVFETNSSSVHSICITKNNNNLCFPDEIYFHHGEFGWEEDIIASTENKADYLYQAILEIKNKKEKKKMLDILKNELEKRGIEVGFENDSIDSCGFSEGYIDHAEDLQKWLDWLFEDTERIIRFLFSDESFIHTGNDNEEMDLSINVPYEHDEYWK